MGKLSKRQKQVLHLLSRGASYESIKNELGISLANLHMVCWQIRKRTGIRSTKDATQCRMARLDDARQKLEATSAQKRILTMLAQGLTHKQIEQTTGLCAQTIQDHVCAGCKRLGITRSKHNRLAKIRAALGIGVPTMDDPFFN